MKHPLPPSDIRKKSGRQFLWFDLEERYVPLIDEGESMPPEAHYRAAEQMTTRLHHRRHGR